MQRKCQVILPQDEHLHSGAYLDAFTAALNSDISGMPTSHPHDSNGFPVPYNPTYNNNSSSKMVSKVISSDARSFQFSPVTPEKNVQNERAQNNQSPSNLIDFCNERANQEKKQDGSHLASGSLLQIAPVTPEKDIERARNNQSPLKLIDFGVDESINLEKNQEGSLQSGVSQSNEVTEICCDHGLSQSSAIHSFQLQEIPKSDKGEIHVRDLNRMTQQKPKKKKHRPKVIRENKATKTPKTVTPKQAGGNENTSRKKRSVGKPSSKESMTPLADVGESVDLATRPHVPSCKRTLNFETVAQDKYECPSTSENCRTVLVSRTDGSITNPHIVDGPEVINPSARLSFDLNHSMTQLSDTSLPLLENQSISSPLKRKIQSRENLKMLARKRSNMETTIVCVDGQANGNAAMGNYIPPEEMCAATFSFSANHNNYEAMLSCPKPVAKSNLDPKISSAGQLPHTEPGIKESKWEYGHTAYNNFFHRINLIEAHFYPMQTRLEMIQGYNQYPGVGNHHGPQYPPIYRKERAKKPKNGSSELAYDTSTFTMPMGHIHSAQNFPKENQVVVGFHQPKAYENMLTLRKREQNMMKRSKAATRLRNLASISAPVCNQILAAPPKTAMGYDGKQENGFFHGPEHCMKTLVAKEQTKMVTKNPVTGSYIVNSVPFSPTNQVQAQKNEIVISDDRQSSVGSTGAPVGQKFIHSNSSPHRKFQVQNSHILSANLIPNCRSSSNLCETDGMVSFAEYIDDIVLRLKSLNIHSDGEIVTTQPQNLLVPYVGHGKMVPYEGTFDPTKKRRPRPKVNLDMETLEQWKLLMGKDSSQTLEGTDEEKEKWWEEERRVFCGRADSFIARMHLVQGDRRFSQWKGSVVDSVVGVFLTQNVSDHLSSSAFMSLAARFPLPSKTNSKEPNIDGKNISQDVSVLDFDDTTKWQGRLLVKQMSDQSSVTHHETETGEEKEIASSSESFGSNNLNGKVNCLQYTHLAICETGQEMCRDSAGNQIGISVTTTDGTSLAEPEDRCQEDISYSIVSSQNSTDSTIQTADRIGSSLESNSEAEKRMTTYRWNCLDSSTSFTELLHMAGSNIFPELRINGNDDMPYTGNLLHAFEQANRSKHQINPLPTIETETSPKKEPKTCNNLPIESTRTSSAKALLVCSDLPVENTTNVQIKAGELDCEEESTHVLKNRIHIEALAQKRSYVMQQSNSSLGNYEGETLNVMECSRLTDNMGPLKGKLISSSRDEVCSSEKTTAVKTNDILKAKARAIPQNRNVFDWENLRKQVTNNGAPRERSQETMDTLDWEAIRCADVDAIAQTIKERGMNNMLAERIKAFLNRLVEEHGSIDLEWLRDVPPDKAKDYLLSIRGLGLKSVECVRLLALQHLAFPVDTNVGRICVRLGWVPLQPLPESLQLHLLELYPVLESIQKYLWPRLCKLDQRTLYELHYQLITFGKVFCTKSRPNCNACPMRGECKHFASAFASARLALPGPEERSLISSVAPLMAGHHHKLAINPMPLTPPPAVEANSHTQADDSINKCDAIMVHEHKNNCEPIIEEPATPEQDYVESSESAIEDTLYEDPDEIPTIKLNLEELALHVQNYIQENRVDIRDGDMSKALVTLTPEVASIPTPKLKNVSRLRTEHQVYELPDTHPLLEGLDPREPDDPCTYLLAIWTPGETAESIEPPEVCCDSQASGGLCDKETCFGCNSIREANSQTVRGTLLIPCRTAMRGSFPLNGTYFQVNEVFADHDSSLNPIDVPRSWIWNLPRRTVFFGTSIPTIFRGLTTEGIQYCFWRGFVCVRGFDQKTRAPRPLMARLHFPASKLARPKKASAQEASSHN